jgi:hypothetical protein
MTTRIEFLAVLSVAATSLALTACGGGGDASPNAPAAGTPVTPTADTTPGVWKGTISSTTTGQTANVVALTGHDGQTVWMAADGRTWHGQLPLHGDHFDATLTGHMADGAQFPDGTNHGTATMGVDHHTTSVTRGHHTGNGDAGSFEMSLSAMWNRTAALETVAGVYTRTTSNGYAMTMSIDDHGQMAGSDTQGCVFGGTVTVPDPRHNLYTVDAQVTSCGTLDGHYTGMGALLDASAMQDWMTAMHPLEHGGHSHGGPMMGGGHMGHNTVPSGNANLFMFCVVNDRGAVMDALAR